jgi:glycosyltransferase involved in cell wall biosynthesis
MGWRWQRAGLRRLIDQIRPDVLHGHVATEHAFYAALCGYQPLMVSTWGSDVLLHPQESWGYRQIVRYTLRRARVLHVQSAHAAASAQALGVPASRILTTVFGIEERWLEMAARAKAPIRPVIISTRALERVYDVGTLIDAMALVRQQQPVVLRLYGEGSMRSMLEAQARRLGLAGVVEFHGSRPHEQLPALLAQGQVYASASLSDSASVSLLEAMAVGLCPVVSDIPANRAWVTEGENGLLFPVGDAAALARQLVRALGDADWRSQVAVRNKALVKARALWRDHMARVEAVYETLAAGHQP